MSGNAVPPAPEIRASLRRATTLSFCKKMKPEWHSITLNLPYDLSDEEWSKVYQVYKSIEGYIEPTSNNCPSWFGREGDERFIDVSVEPSGLLCEGIIESGLWCGWLTLLCSRLSLSLGHEVRDAEM